MVIVERRIRGQLPPRIQGWRPMTALGRAIAGYGELQGRAPQLVQKDVRWRTVVYEVLGQPAYRHAG
jgi:hypothetical protein